MRRIEAITGRCFGENFRAGQQVVKTLCRIFKTQFSKIPDQVEVLSDKIKSLEKETYTLRMKVAFSNMDELLKNANEIKGIKFIKEYLRGCDRESIQAKAEALVAKAGSGIAALFGTQEGKCAIIVAVSPDLITGKKLHAGNILKSLSEAAGGKGGGRPNLAQGGAKDEGLLESVFARAEEIVGGFIK